MRFASWRARRAREFLHRRVNLGGGDGSLLDRDPVRHGDLHGARVDAAVPFELVGDLVANGVVAA